MIEETSVPTSVYNRRRAFMIGCIKDWERQVTTIGLGSVRNRNGNCKGNANGAGHLRSISVF